MEHRWCGVRSSKSLRGRLALSWVGSIPTHPRKFCLDTVVEPSVYSQRDAVCSLVQASMCLVGAALGAKHVHFL